MPVPTFFNILQPFLIFLETFVTFLEMYSFFKDKVNIFQAKGITIWSVYGWSPAAGYQKCIKIDP